MESRNPIVLMDRLAGAALLTALLGLGASFFVANDLAEAVSFGVFVSAFAGAVGAFGLGHFSSFAN